MVIMIDTREQERLSFPKDSCLDNVESATLSIGDYACRFKDGTIPAVRFERKSVGDLFGTMTHGYKRFKAEMKRAQDEGIRLILIIEAPLGDVRQGYGHSQFDGSSMEQKLFTMMIRYGLHTVFCSDRREMSRYILEYFKAIGREYMISVRANKGLMT